MDNDKHLEEAVAKLPPPSEMLQKPVPQPKIPKQQSRADRWNGACHKIRDGLDELLDLQSEYQDWRDNLPENLDSSPIAEKLNTVCDLDFASVEIDEWESIDLPLGFGRD